MYATAAVVCVMQYDEVYHVGHLDLQPVLRYEYFVILVKIMVSHMPGKKYQLLCVLVSCVLESCILVPAARVRIISVDTCNVSDLSERNSEFCIILSK